MAAVLLAALVFSQAPECVTANGQRVCGYDCKRPGGSAQCAQTPAGICSDSAGRIICFDPPIWLSRVYGKNVPKPACLWRGQNGACGYDCKAQLDQVGCAATPQGVCIAQYNKVLCFDPQPALYGVYGKGIPEPRCLAQDGHLACGYGCKSTGGRLACAATPHGVCEERDGQLVCFDPDKLVLCARGKGTPKPACLMGFGQLVCGYDCKAASGRVACAQTPDGTCDTAGANAPTCFDPPVRGTNDSCLSLLGSQ